MAIALGATGWFMYIDIPETPKAVVACVIIYNAFFGYRYVIYEPLRRLSQYFRTAGARFHGCIPLRYL
jgi:hypothetical protein